MSAEFLFEAIKATDIAELKTFINFGTATVNPDQKYRRDGGIVIVDTIANATPNYNLSNIAYRYEASNTQTELLPAVVEPDDSNGRFVMMAADRAHYATVAPSAAPPLANMLWMAFLTSPERTVIWRSPPNLIDSPTVADWLPDFAPISVAGVPTFNADFVGQKVKDTATDLVYEAVNITGDWKLSLPDNGWHKGTDITGNITLGLANHGQRQTVMASSVVTLPVLTEEIEVEFIVFDAIAAGTVTLSLSPDTGTTLNGATSSIDVNEIIVRVFNHGTEWFFK